MKLNPDCIRDILLSVEDTSTFDQRTIYDSENMNLPRLKNYSHDEIIYHINQCDLSDLLNDVSILYDGNFASIGDLSPYGHEFLANIRSDNVWNGVKSVAGKVGSASLDALIQIASNVITELIKAQFGLI